MDAIFKALGDPARRAILDSLRARDGQTLTDLEGQFEMTRFGVMKHLNVLEDASLIVTTRKGRFKYHYLNALPLQEAIDRWIDPLLAKPAARAVIDLKSKLETAPMLEAIKTPDFVHQTIIQCSAAALWDALVSGEATSHYYFDTVLEGEAAPGETLIYRAPDGSEMLSCDVIAADPPRRLEMTFAPHFIPGAPSSRHVYVIDEMQGACRLTIEHYDLPPEMQGIRDGWVLIASRLKTWLETGKPLPVSTMGG
ncbi:helix-turn-helix domain-containing protein [Hasllibacter sp. MH4015]|uniref:ArsR/SmtB family transcription factor n=1 Tax=Hasllibacter sp. MH4015 TaxID=2854029 RepID=UPI001CD23EA2|nr:helix-turn-helix domain-containing protein [Hasllibacter sp. MH4015]